MQNNNFWCPRKDFELYIPFKVYLASSSLDPPLLISKWLRSLLGFGFKSLYCSFDCILVPKKGFEPSHLTAYASETYVSTNSTTWASTFFSSTPLASLGGMALEYCYHSFRVAHLSFHYLGIFLDLSSRKSIFNYERLQIQKKELLSSHAKKCHGLYPILFFETLFGTIF